jgi:hypothetical protein
MVNRSFKGHSELLQLFKIFFDANCKGKNYNPVAARAGKEMGSGVSSPRGCTQPVPSTGAILRTIKQTELVIDLTLTAVKLPLQPTVVFVWPMVLISVHTSQTDGHSQLCDVRLIFLVNP